MMMMMMLMIVLVISIIKYYYYYSAELRTPRVEDFVKLCLCCYVFLINCIFAINR